MRRCAVGLACFAALAGCSSTPTQATDAHAKRDTEIHHEACDVESSSAVKKDLPGQTHTAEIDVVKGGKLVCKMLDLNMDGRPDVFVYYDDSGAVRRREADYDRDGRPDEVILYKNGKVYEKDRSMNASGKLDTWDTYDDSERLVKRERATKGDGQIDEWWDFYDATHPECAIVSKDKGGNGNPDPETAVDLCKEGPVAASSATPSGSSSVASASAAPVAPPPPPPAPPPPPPPAPASSSK